MTKIGIIIVAGGSGTRMGAGVPKQFLPVCGKEILVHALEKFLSALGSIGAANINAGAGAAIGKQAGKAGEQAENGAKNEAGIGTNMRKALTTNIAANINGSATISAEIVIVLPAGHIPAWNEIAAKHSLTDTHRVCAGGQNRFMSVYNGLEALGKCDIIAIHDGVRPLLSQELICRCLTLAGAEGTAIPVVEPVDSFRILTGGPTPNTPDPAPAQPAAETEASITGTESGNPQTGIAAEGPPVNSMEQINSPIHDSTRTCSTKKA